MIEDSRRKNDIIFQIMNGGKEKTTRGNLKHDCQIYFGLVGRVMTR